MFVLLVFWGKHGLCGTQCSRPRHLEPIQRLIFKQAISDVKNVLVHMLCKKYCRLLTNSRNGGLATNKGKDKKETSKVGCSFTLFAKSVCKYV